MTPKEKAKNLLKNLKNTIMTGMQLATIIALNNMC